MKKYSLNDPLTFFEKTAIFELNPKAVPLTIFKSKREAKVLKIIHPLGILMAISAFFTDDIFKAISGTEPSQDIIKQMSFAGIFIALILLFIEHLLLLVFMKQVAPIELEGLYSDSDEKENIMRRRRVIKIRAFFIPLFAIITLLYFLVSMGVIHKIL